MYITNKVIGVRMRSTISSSLCKTNAYARDIVRYHRSQVGLRLSRRSRLQRSFSLPVIEILLLYRYLYREVLSNESILN